MSLANQACDQDDKIDTFFWNLGFAIFLMTIRFWGWNEK